MPVPNQTHRPAHIARAMIGTGLLLVLTGVHHGGPPASDPDKKGTRPAPEAPLLEVRLSDNSAVRMTLLDEKIDIQTRYGKLTVPAGDVRRIEFGLRFPPGVARKIDAAIANLGSSDFKER